MPDVSFELHHEDYECLRILGDPVQPMAILDARSVDRPPLIVEVGLVAFVRRGAFSHRVMVPWAAAPCPGDPATSR